MRVAVLIILLLGSACGGGNNDTPNNDINTDTPVGSNQVAFCTTQTLVSFCESLENEDPDDNLTNGRVSYAYGKPINLLTAGNPTQITSSQQSILDGFPTLISGVIINSGVDINGMHMPTVLSADTLSIPVDTSGSDYNLSNANISSHMAWSHIEDGYSNDTISNTGALRGTSIDLPPSLLHSADLNSSIVAPTDRLSVGQLNIGFLMRISQTFLTAWDYNNGDAARTKHVILRSPEPNPTGGRPILYIIRQEDRDNRISGSLPLLGEPAGQNYYWVPVLAQDANGTARTDEFGVVANNSYVAGRTHNFRWNDYVNEWVYVEIEFVDRTAGDHKLWIYTQDGLFQGGTGTPDQPLITVASIFDLSIHGNMQAAGIWDWMMATVGADANTTYDTSNIRVHTSFMGPPPDFLP